MTASKPSTGADCAISSALPSGMPSAMSNRAMSPSSFKPASRASVPPIWPAPTSAIFLRAMKRSSSLMNSSPTPEVEMLSRIDRKDPPRRWRAVSCHGMAASAAPVQRHEVAPRAAGVDLAGTADLLVGILDHLHPLGDPADRARDREQGGEHADRDAHRLEHDAGVEI